MTIDWVEVQSIATAVLVLTSAGAIAYAALQLRHEREYRAVANLEKQLGFFLVGGLCCGAAEAGGGAAEMKSGLKGVGGG